jgi:hypothetical protein
VGAPTGETFARTAQDDASSPSIELIKVRNSNELQVGDQAAGPRPPVRVVWPIPVSEVQPAEVSKADAKDQSARMVSPEADAAVNAGTESAASPGEGTSGTSRMGQLAVLIFLSFGLPGAGILAWVVMRADNTRGEQLAGTHFHATGADDRRPENKRRARGLDARREAARLDDFLAHLAEHPQPVCGMRVSHLSVPFSPVRMLLKRCCATSCGPSGPKWPQNMIPAAMLPLKGE